VSYKNKPYFSKKQFDFRGRPKNCVHYFYPLVHSNTCRKEKIRIDPSTSTPADTQVSLETINLCNIVHRYDERIWDLLESSKARVEIFSRGPSPAARV
jgi:hypothetical protein